MEALFVREMEKCAAIDLDRREHRPLLFRLNESAVQPTKYWL